MKRRCFLFYPFNQLPLNAFGIFGSFDMDFRKIIQSKMKKEKVNIPKLARLIECNTQTLYNYFHYRSELNAELLGKIFDVLEITIK